MKYPCLVQKIFCKTEIEVELEQEGVTRYGEPLPVFAWKGTCNYQDKGKTVLFVKCQFRGKMVRRF